MKSTIVTAATVEPVTVPQVREHSRIDIQDEDPYLATRITAAREAAEARTRSVFITQTWDDSFDGGFDDVLVLAKQPVQSITSVTYTDTDGDTQTVAVTVYELGEVHGRGVVRLKYGQVWPTDVRAHADSIAVRYVAGYGLATAVPQPVIAAIELYVSHYNEAREGETPLSKAFQTMLGPYCFYQFPNP